MRLADDSGRIERVKTTCKKQSSNPSPVADILSLVVLVGTYKGNQLKEWPGWYCWPLDTEEAHAKSAKSAEVSSCGDAKTDRDAPTARPQPNVSPSSTTDAISRVTELWLFQGTREQRNYKAEFVGIKTRNELVRDHGYPAKGRPHGDRYALFKTERLYRHKNALPEEADAVIVRTKDFARRSPKVAAQLKAYLESPDRNDPDLAKSLPAILATIPPERLRVCEAAYQLSFWDLPQMAPVLKRETAERIDRQEQKVCPPIAEYSRLAAAELRNAAADERTTPIRVIELFAGVGGFRVGLERASNRFETVWNNQWEPSTKRQDASIVYQSQFGIAGHSNEDIGTVGVSQIPEADLLVGGFPCQDYSVANTLKRSGGIEGKKGVLWWQIHRILRDSPTPPQYLFLENVDRLVKSPATQRGRDFAIILASLSDLGYAVEWRIINAADYGMPQRRRRTYIVAYRDGTQLAKDAAAVKDPATWIMRDGVIAHAFDARPADSSSIANFDIEGTLPEVTKKFNAETPDKSPFFNAGFMVHRRVWTQEMQPVYDGIRLTLGQLLIDEKNVSPEFFIDGNTLDEWKYLKGPKSEMRTTPEGFEYHYTEGGMAFPDPLDKPSRTIITGEGGSSPSRFKHVILTPSGRYRRLVPVELERLNMFPDNHTEKASDGRRAFLMGNALVTGIVERIGLVLKERM